MSKSRELLVCAVLVCMAFGLVYARSLTFVYVEGDDAETVAYHALGRNEAFQPPYTPYQSMFDAVLSGLPAREDVVRKTAIALSAVSASIFFALTMVLAFEWSGVAPAARWPVLLISLLSVPEIFYLGMVTTPSMVAMALLVASHLVVRRARTWTSTSRAGGFAASAVLFGVGAAFRWDTVLYGVTIAADLLTGTGVPRDSLKQRTIRVAGWGLGAVVVWLSALYISGYSTPVVLGVIRRAGPMEPLSLVYGVSRIQTLITPAFALSCAAGIVVLARRRHPLPLVALLSLVTLGKLTLFGVPKWMITAVPSLMALGVSGTAAIWTTNRNRLAIVALALFPWVVGMRLTYSGVAWGPGFEVQRYDAVAQQTTWPRPTLGGGTAIPTPEGPRPLFGHGWVLGGEWKQFVTRYWAEQPSALNVAIARGQPAFFADYSQGWGVDAYLSLGFTTTDSAFRVVDGELVERRWRRADGVTSRMLAFLRPMDLYAPETIQRLQRVAGDTVIIFAFTSTLATLHGRVPESLDPLGTSTAVFRIDRFAARTVARAAHVGQQTSETDSLDLRESAHRIGSTSVSTVR